MHLECVSLHSCVSETAACALSQVGQICSIFKLHLCVCLFISLIACLKLLYVLSRVSRICSFFFELHCCVFFFFINHPPFYHPPLRPLHLIESVLTALSFKWSFGDSRIELGEGELWPTAIQQVASALGHFSAAQQARLTLIFQLSGLSVAFYDRWSSTVAAMIQTPMRVLTERVLSSIVKHAVSSVFDGFSRKERRRCKKLESKALLKWEALMWDASSADKLLQGFGKLDALKESLEECRAAVGLLKKAPKASAAQLKQQWTDRDAAWCSWKSQREMADALETLYKKQSSPDWAGYQRYPEPQRRWRCCSSSWELRNDQRFAKIRAAVSRFSSRIAPSLDSAASSVTSNKDLGVHGRSWHSRQRPAWAGADDRLDWVFVMRLQIHRDIEGRRRTRLFSTFQRSAKEAISLATDGTDVRVVGTVSKTSLAGWSPDKDVILLRDTLVKVAQALDVRLEPELER